ncbi:MAG: acetoacetate--CoA ligase [Candidatus Marinimicrobia bacterium]|nr:acetoacetate--CoA ligase [Candidatus Neomarinimicrobiota bacterium]|tara:strand:- start:24444 stop:26372 length:1929 start_codon:yes stop_codon:yes gene_type:complete
MKNKVFWKPPINALEKTNIIKFKNLINQKYAIKLNNYSELYEWSVQNNSDFWEEVWQYSDIICSNSYIKVLSETKNIWDAKWFEGSKLNYAENLLRYKNNNNAIYFFGEDQVERTLTFSELQDSVARLAYSLKKIGLSKGDRVAAVVPNIPEAVIGMLATASIGGIWSSCSPDFGIDGILDRFSQINPKVFICSDGYFYKGKKIDCNNKNNKILNSLKSVEKSIIINYINSGDSNWDELLDNSADSIDFEQVDFSDPLYIMYSSGTTGKPKSIVHSVGGTLIQHYKEHILHVDLKENDKIFYFTTCGWMMWNWLVGGLAVGSSIVLYDGNPFYPYHDSLLRVMNSIDIDVFGTSAKYISALESLSIKPDSFKFDKLRSILSTGSTLTGENYEYVYSHWKKNVQLCSISGGTDIISCFALGNPVLPVYKNELQCIGLGMSVKSYNERGIHELNHKGELVCDRPFPSMPIGFWNDSDNKKYINTYFSDYSNTWKHGDYITINNHGGVIIHGRSDATLNPGGIRIGTSEIYQVVEKHPKVLDSVVVGYEFDNDEKIILFLKLKENQDLTDELINEVRQLIKNKCSPRHIPSLLLQVDDIPYTINGKKVELAIKKIIHNQSVNNKDSLSNPECLEQYKIKIEKLLK